MNKRIPAPMIGVNKSIASSRSRFRDFMSLFQHILKFLLASNKVVADYWIISEFFELKDMLAESQTKERLP